MNANESQNLSIRKMKYAYYVVVASSTLVFLLTLVAPADGFGSSFQTRRRRPTRMSSDDTIANYAGCKDNARRSLLIKSLVAASVGTLPLINSPNHASASEVRGPVELLRPATRIRLYIDQAVEICQSIKAEAASSASYNNRSVPTSKVLEPLHGFFQQEPNFMTEEESRLANRYLDIGTSAAWQSARRKERETMGAEMGIDYTTPYDKLNTAVQAWGDNRQFQILRARQRRLERASAMREAFNAYTNNLVFGDVYRLNVEGDAKKAMVRNDALPNVNAVVVSDLDLRDLYRNQVLQNVDDAKAELLYQLKTGELDVDEILQYLLQAQSSCKEWFSFIPKVDVDEALQVVLVNASE